MLTTLFKAVLGTSLSTAPCILILIAAAPLLRRRYTARLSHGLWLAVALRMLFPVTLWENRGLVIPEGKPVVRLDNDAAAIARAFAEAPKPDAGGVTVPMTAPTLSWMGIAAMIWLCGAVAVLAWGLVSHAVTSRRLRRWSAAVTYPQTLAILEEVKAEVGVKGSISLYRSFLVDIPLLSGYLRPRILLPAVTIDPVHLRNVLRHELTHCKRRDLWYKLLMLLFCAVHWFNPLVWLAASRAEAAMELACDQDSLAGAEGQARREYGFSIIAFLPETPRKSLPLTTSFAGGSKQMKRRLSGILDMGGKKRGIAVAAAALAVLAISGSLVGCGIGAVEEAASAAPIEPKPVEIAELEEPAYGESEEVFEEAGEGEPALTLEEQREEMERLFLENLEENKEKSAEIQQEIDEILKLVHLDDRPYLGGEMMWPLPGFYQLSSVYGWRYGNTDFHTGIDITGEGVYGASAVAAASGMVAFVNTEYEPGRGYGQYIVLDHGGGITTLYAQLSQVLVSPGDTVEAGDIVGSVGSTGFSTGPHLHFEVRQDSAHTDPAPYLLGEETDPEEQPQLIAEAE